MILSYEQMGDLMEEIAGQFPDVFFLDLGGGIQLEETALSDPAFPPGEMYIMGEYCSDLLGRYIVLYYGSFVALLRDAPKRIWREEIFQTVAHEFTHHLEATAMLHALDDKDSQFLRDALQDLEEGPKAAPTPPRKGLTPSDE